MRLQSRKTLRQRPVPKTIYRNLATFRACCARNASVKARSNDCGARLPGLVSSEPVQRVPQFNISRLGHAKHLNELKPSESGRDNFCASSDLPRAKRDRMVPTGTPNATAASA